MTELNYLDITKASDGHIKVPSIGLTSPAITESIAKTSLASFADGAGGFPFRVLKGYINPVQNLNGQSAPYPAGGGDNKFNIANCVAYAAAFGLSHAIDGEYVRFYGTCSSGGTHGWRFVYVGSAMQTIGSTLSYKAFIVSGTPSITINSITYNSDNTLSISVGGLVTNQAYDFKIGVFGYTGTAPAAWSPYSNICPITGWTGMNVTVSPTLDAQDGTTYPISWSDEAGTVYGGTLDVTTGLLTVTHGMIDMATVTMQGGTSGTGYVWYYTLTNPATVPNSQIAHIISEEFAAIRFNGVTSNTNTIAIRDTGVLYVNNGSTTTQPTTKAVYELATPVTYQLTPTEVLSILGTNNVWVDTNGDVECTYIADTKLYIDAQIAAL